MVRNNLKHWRHKFEMTQTEFAAMLGIDRQQYNRYEHQAIQPTLETALKLAKKLNIPVEQVFYLESPEK